jgi:outer membrane receptor for ferrienterochelin and colicin
MKTHIRAALCCGLSVGIIAPVTHATANPEQMTVTATRLESAIDATGSSISVVTADQIKRQNAKDLQQALKLMPGLNINASCSCRAGRGLDNQ